MSAAGDRCPLFVLREDLALAALGRRHIESVLDPSPLHSQLLSSPDFRFEDDVAELIARRIGWLPSVDRPAPPGLSIPPPEALTDGVISKMQSYITALNLDGKRIPAILCRTRWSDVEKLLSGLRKLGKLDDARRVASQSVALAKRLAQLYPDQPAAYLILSGGYVQKKAKNAYQEDGASPIPWERKALDAAIHAASLDPENDGPRYLVQNRRVRLSKLTSE